MDAAKSSSLILDFFTPESELVPDSLPSGAFVCTRCHLVHEDRQAWDRGHSRLWPCSRCGLVHMEYMLLAMLYGFKEFDCKVFIPDLDNVVMHGDSVKFDPQVLKMLDEKQQCELTAGKDDDTATVR
ncbi:hypothetical protein PVAP13_6NG115218 [Panicum virgatum]|uniref:Uncharacterized protein n=1 Tax=Panicum virgatum TaxID=38727 RepID=A0A8T0QZE5_PANVG|nr:hypothetical protein PVAP13_6NG115218 [Panicum virgatum]